MKLYEYVIRVNDQGTRDMKNFASSVSRSDTQVDRLNRSMTKSETGARRMGRIFSGLKSTIAGAFAVGAIGSFLGKINSAGMEFEKTKTTFETMLGSADKANKMLRDLDNFANATPFENDTLNENAKLLLNFGTAGDRILPTLRMLGDVSAGDKQKLDSLTLAFAQVSSQGKLMGQDLLQMINAGFNPLQELSVMTGKSMGELKDQMSKGAISAQMVEKAFAHATGPTGKFFKMMEKQSETASGKASTAMGKLGLLFRNLGTQTLPFVKSGLNGVIAVLDKLNGKSKTQSELLGQERTRFNALMSTLRSGNITQKQRSKLIGEINTRYKDYLPNLLSEKSSVQDLAKAQESVNTQLLKKIALQAREEEMTKKLTALYQKQEQLAIVENKQLGLEMLRNASGKGEKSRIRQDYGLGTNQESRIASNLGRSVSGLKSEISEIEKSIKKGDDLYDKIFAKIFGKGGDSETSSLAQVTKANTDGQQSEAGISGIASGGGGVNITFGEVRFAEEINLNVENVEEGLGELKDKFNEWFGSLLNGAVRTARTANG